MNQEVRTTNVSTDSEEEDDVLVLKLVSKQMDFNQQEGNDVDFTKTFDLTGNNNDEMLKFYLRKAGLSDNIEYLTSEQRRAFIYDIVKSNKNPGYWKPSVLPQTTPLRPLFYKPPVDRESSITLESIDDIPPASITFDLDKYRQFKNTNSIINGEQNKNVLVEQKANPGSTLYERQFSQKQSLSKKVVNSPPIPLQTNTLITKKGRIIEVSGPTNFRHISGDMTRDMTKNTFDLSGNFNNNSLKKYMIERGITEEDVSCLERKDLIRRIVQSNYTWVPPRGQLIRNAVPPPPSEKYVAAESKPASSPRNINLSKGGAIIVTPPMLPAALEPSNEPIYEEIVQSKRNTTSIRRHRRKPLPPPPPVPVNANKVSDLVFPQQLTNLDNTPTPVDGISSNCKPALPPSPPPPPPPPPSNPLTMPIEGTSETKNVPSPPPPPPPMHSMLIEQTIAINGNCPPPPPPPPPIPLKVFEESRSTEILTLTESKSPKTQQTQPKKSISIVPLPPLDQFPNTNDSKSNVLLKPTQTGSEVDRNALLESIRGGVILKKVNNQEKQLKTKVGTPIVMKQYQQLNTPPTSIKQVHEHPEKPDFMSELRNATLKRIKKLENNPYASESEC